VFDSPQFVKHSHTDGCVSHTRHHPAYQDTSTLGQVELGIEPPTFWFVENLHETLSHCRPEKHVIVTQKSFGTAKSQSVRE